MAKLKIRVKNEYCCSNHETTLMLKESDTLQMSQQVASLSVPCAWTHGHIYKGHKPIEHLNYVDAFSKTTSLYAGLDLKQARHMRV